MQPLEMLGKGEKWNSTHVRNGDIFFFSSVSTVHSQTVTGTITCCEYFFCGLS